MLLRGINDDEPRGTVCCVDVKLSASALDETKRFIAGVIDKHMYFEKREKRKRFFNHEDGRKSTKKERFKILDSCSRTRCLS
mgnify:CR=1 FL=1